MEFRLRVLSAGFLASMIGLAACHDGGSEEAGEGSALPTPIDADVTLVAADGLPTYVSGDLGRAPADLDAGDPEGAMQPVLARITPFFQVRDDQLRLASMRTDDIGYRHLRYRQEVDGLEVVGGQLDLHIDHRGVVYLANGSARDFAIASSPTISLADARAGLTSNPRTRGLSLDGARLVYLIASGDGSRHLAWEIVARGTRGGDPVRDLVYVDAHRGAVVDVHPTIHAAKSRATHNLFNGTALPGTLQRSEGQGPVADVDVNFAHDFAGDTYDCYAALFARDSYNNAGALLRSSVHYSSNYVNAFWNGTQMVYGDGDGVTAIQLDRGFDVVAHELTHAVTENESGLIYANESGALNEANSDTFAAICEEWKDGAVSGDTWKVGEDVWTPGTAGDALRYMNNPTIDGSSRDYYPTRYTGPSDNGGVHWNSGIPNLAFYLAVQGGQHPRGVTPSITVAALGIDVAAQIWYRAATTYSQSTTNMAAASAACVQAATDLYPADPSVRQSIANAWAAVGVAPPEPPPPTVALEKAVPVTGVNGPPDRTYALDVPAGATSVTFTLAGSNGDADLYGKFGSIPTTSDYEARSISATSNESITIPTAGRAGLYYIYVQAYSAYTGVTVTGNHNGATPPPPPGELDKDVPVAGVHGITGSQTRFTFKVPAGATSVTFTTSGGVGNADLYIQRGSPPDTGAGQYQYRSIGGTNSESITVNSGGMSGTWHVLLQGTAGYNGLTITASYTPLVIKTYRDLAGATGDVIRKQVSVPAGATRLTFTMSGGTGNADLYVRFGSPPRVNIWDYRPYLPDNNESVVIVPPNVGTYYLMVRGFTDFSGVTLRVTVEE
jgi:vibriolysin